MIDLAILKINPNAEFSVNKDLHDIDRAEITWDAGTPPISKEDIINLKKTLLNLNFQKSTGQLEKTHEIKKSKKNLARLKMNINKIIGDNNA